MKILYHTIPYTLVRSRRKTLAIYINKDSTVEVRAPLKAPKSDIDKFIAEKENWIRTHLERRKRLNDEKADFTLNYGDLVPFGGLSFPIVPKEGNLAGFDGEAFYVPSGLSPAGIKTTVVRIYKALAKNGLSDKARRYAEYMGVVPTAIKITNAKTRWGSCSGANSINFSWRLVMADEDVIDYVVVHELAHIIEHNHSNRFWGIVQNVLPDFIDRKKKLKPLQEKLAAQDWD